MPYIVCTKNIILQPLNPCKLKYQNSAEWLTWSRQSLIILGSLLPSIGFSVVYHKGPFPKPVFPCSQSSLRFPAGPIAGRYSCYRHAAWFIFRKAQQSLSALGLLDGTTTVLDSSVPAAQLNTQIIPAPCVAWNWLEIQTLISSPSCWPHACLPICNWLRPQGKSQGLSKPD